MDETRAGRASGGVKGGHGGGVGLVNAAPAADVDAGRSATATLRTLAVLAAAVLVPAVAFIVAFPDRTDYVGHYLAGAGGTALLLAIVAALPGRRPWLVVAGAAAAVVAGVGTELTVFRLAIFDPVDLATQSLGAVIVGAGLIGAHGTRRLAAGLVVLALLLLGAGFRYAFA
jgi:hypothetical protein